MTPYAEKIAYIAQEIEKLDQSIAYWSVEHGENALMVRQYKHLRKDFIKQLNEVMQMHGLMVQEV